MLKKVRTTASTCHRCLSFSVVCQTLVAFVLWFIGLLLNRRCYLIGNGKGWFHLTIFLDWIGQQLEQPAGSDSSLCIYNNILMCPLWDHDICAVDFHKSVTSEKRLLISPWLKLLLRDLFKESSLSWYTYIICFEKQTLTNKRQCYFRCSQVQQSQTDMKMLSLSLS